MTEQNIRKPNFFILGAPKCGTSSLYHYLDQHAKIFMSKPKEPNYFNTDFSEEWREYFSESEYLEKCFTGWDNEPIAGEASTGYLFSKEAVSNILEFNPEAKFIVMVRNPLSMARSLHAQRIQSHGETITEFKKAWRLQEQRRRGKKIPYSCQEPKFLLYGDFCKLGGQVEELFDQVSQDRVKVIVFDDFIEDTIQVYKDTLSFLGVDYDGRSRFPAVNSKQTPSSWVVFRFNQFLRGFAYPNLKSLSHHLKNILGIERWGIISTIRKLNFTEKPKTKKEKNNIDNKFEQELADYFAKDVQKLSKLLDRDLSHWLDVSKKS